MTTATVWLGAAPRDEPGPGDTDPGDALRVARAYRLAVLMVAGDPPPGATLRVLRAPDDHPALYEVACEYDPADPAAVDYAGWCRVTAPSTWAAAGMDEPAVGPQHGRT